MTARTFSYMLAGVAAFVLAGSAGAARDSGPRVDRISPEKLTLVPGARTPAQVTLSGEGLDGLTSAIVIDARGSPAANVTVTLARSSDPRRRVLALQAGERAAAGSSLRLRLMAGRETVELPSRLLAVEVAAAKPVEQAPPPGHAQLAPLMSCQACHDALQENLAGKFTWDSRPVVQADVQQYSLHAESYGATLERIVHGERIARTSDNLPCSACHHPGNPDRQDMTNVTRDAFCSTWEPIFYGKQSKPANLKQFFNNWKTRGCPQ